MSEGLNGSLKIGNYWSLCQSAYRASKQNNFALAKRFILLAQLYIDDPHLPEDLIKGRNDYMQYLREYVSCAEQKYSRIYRKKETSIFDLYKCSQRDATGTEQIGIAVFAHTRSAHLRLVLESLLSQGEIGNVEVWVDGHQGSESLRLQVEKTIDVARVFHLKKLHIQEGQYGFRKMLILALIEMCDKYEDIIVLEDDCFPTRDAICEFKREISEIRNKTEIFSVYGHHFIVEKERNTCNRFQGWGWATTSKKLRPILDELLACYLMNESTYLDFVENIMTPKIREQIDVTPGRQPSSVLKKFFAWDETICLLTAKRGLVHKPTKKRVIYNFGMGDDSTHFPEIPMFRNPPFNLITIKEVWDYF